MMAVCKKRTGTCKCFGNSTGFGFIIAEDGSNVFMHITNCIDGKMPVEGDVLTYELGPSTKKPGKTAALNVTGGSAKQTAEERANGGGKMTPMMLRIMKLEKELTELKVEITKLKAYKIRKHAIPYCDIDVSAEERIKAIEERLAQRESKRSENDMKPPLKTAASVQQPAPPQTHEKSGGDDDNINGILECCESDFATNMAKENTEMSDSQDEEEEEEVVTTVEEPFNMKKLEKMIEALMETPDMEQMAMAPTKSVPKKKKKKK
jgi:CspA family cold shock protein